MKFKCPSCGHKEKPEFKGVFEGIFTKVAIYECKGCHGLGFLRQFDKDHENFDHSPLINSF